ncbi:MAG: peptide ABC transporter substrate-binding protein, partial [Pseudomonadota bacterium]
MDRRRFIAGAVGTASATLSYPLLGQAQTPRRGGRLRLGLSQGGTSDTLDPLTWVDTNMYMIGYALGNNLVELGPDKTPIPELAES